MCLIRADAHVLQVFVPAGGSIHRQCIYWDTHHGEPSCCNLQPAMPGKRIVALGLHSLVSSCASSMPYAWLPALRSGQNGHTQLSSNWVRLQPGLHQHLTFCMQSGTAISAVLRDHWTLYAVIRLQCGRTFQEEAGQQASCRVLRRDGVPQKRITQDSSWMPRVQGQAWFLVESLVVELQSDSTVLRIKDVFSWSLDSCTRKMVLNRSASSYLFIIVQRVQS